MTCAVHCFTLNVPKSPPLSCQLVTAPVQREIHACSSRMSDGEYLCVLCVLTHEVAISCNENADRTVRTDMRTALTKILPTSDAGGVVGKVLCVPCDNTGRMILGTWQGLYLVGGGGRVQMLCVLFNVTRRDKVTVQPDRRGSHDVTAQIDPCLVRSGLVNVWSTHTSCSVSNDTLNNRPSEIFDLEPLLSEMVPDRWSRDGTFEHTMEGDDDMPAHVKTSLMGPATTFVQDTPSRVSVHEHRDSGGWGQGHRRKLVISQLLTGNEPSVNVTQVIALQALKEDSFLCIDWDIQKVLGEHLRNCSIGLLCCTAEGDDIILSTNSTKQPQISPSQLPPFPSLRRVLFGCSHVLPIIDGQFCAGHLTLYACGRGNAVRVTLLGYTHKH
eukprot:GHVS01008111.1.p1 GENE.GHVS01008111.1~~GHVS01008111.1.p1  ORF type:complete len:395 (+),score=30.89 GHVS01008111.1:32-1186(+)